MNIRGTTRLIAHIGYPTHSFKAPMIYNPYFEHAGIDAVVVPMGCEAGRVERAYRGTLILTFGGGTNEIQRDLIAIFGLKMPRSLR